MLLTTNGAAVACGENGDGQCDAPVLGEGLTYAPPLARFILLQASMDGDSMRFTTFGGEERSRTWAGPAARLTDIYAHLTAEHRLGRLGHGADKVDAILPGGRLLSSATAEETVASAALAI